MSDPTPAQLAYLMDRTADEAARQRAVVRARNYHAGAHFVRLDDRLKQFLRDSRGDRDSDFLRLNVCRTVVSAVTERLAVQQLAATDTASSEAAARWWQAARLAILQDEIHTLTVRDGESFLVLGWDSQGNAPRIVPHPRYTDPGIDDVAIGSGSRMGATDEAPRTTGDGFGVKAFYPDDDLSLPMSHATKTWTEVRYGERGQRQVRRRLTVYYPERIEKYAIGTTLEPVMDPGDTAWPIPWLDRQGQPLGIPVVHVRNPDLACEAWEAIPLQNVINKALIDLVTASDLTAFRVLAAFGFYPTTDGAAPKADGSNRLKIQPGTFVGSKDPQGSLQAVDGADLSGFEAQINALIGWTASVTDTPVSRFIFSRQVAAEGTLKQQEGPLLAKIGKRQLLIGEAYAEAFSLARRLHNTYGTGPQLSEASPFEAQWAPAETVDEAAELEALALKREKLDIPLETLWREAGYTAEQIATMRRERARERADAPPPPPVAPGTSTPTASGNPPEGAP